MSFAMRPHDLLVKHPALPAMLADCLPDEWVVVSGGFWFGPYPTCAAALSSLSARRAVLV
jgi:hypothetical protein